MWRSLLDRTSSAYVPPSPAPLPRRRRGPWLKVSNTRGGGHAQCNDKYWAVPWATSGGGGLSGSLYVHAVYRPGKIAQSPFLIRGTPRGL